MRILWRPAITLFSTFSLVCGLLYPLAVTFIGQSCFPEQANGSLISREGRIIGSSLVGQTFEDPRYFFSRPSATSPQSYNAASSSGSNLGPRNPSLLNAVTARLHTLRALDPTNHAPVPIDLLTSSASGLDPDISRAAADYQAARIARLRGLRLDVVRSLISTQAEERWLGFIGEPRVNVLQLNLALDEMSKH